MDAATRPAGKSGNQASHKEDVLICVRLMRTTLGDTYAKLIAPKNVSDLAGGLPLTEAKLAWVANFAHRPKLQTWVNGIVDRGEMYEQPEEPPAEDVIPGTHTAHTHIEPPRYHLHAHTLNSNR